MGTKHFRFLVLGAAAAALFASSTPSEAVSIPFFALSLHVGIWHFAALHTALAQSPAAPHDFPSLQRTHPETITAFDHQPEKMITTRLRLLERAAKEGSLVLASHFPFPGLGYVGQKAGQWEWQPLPSTGPLSFSIGQEQL